MVDFWASQVESGLYGNGTIFRHFKFFLQLKVNFSFLMQGFIHVDFSHLDMIGPTFTDQSTNKFRYKMIWQKQLVMNDMLVERKEFLLIAGIIGREEIEVEEVVMDRNVEYETNATHWFELEKVREQMRKGMKVFRRMGRVLLG